MVTVFVFASFFDAISTAFTVLKPGTKELNPLGAALIQPDATLHTTVLLSLPPMSLLVLILLLWDRATVKQYWETLLEAATTLQIAAGINNTLILNNIIHPITLLTIAAMIGHYATRLHHTWKNNQHRRSLLKTLPKTTS